MDNASYVGERVGNTIRIYGVQFRAESAGYLWPIIAEYVDLIAIKIPGGQVWSGIGKPWKYLPPEILVFRYELQGKELHMHTVLRIPMGMKKS